MSNSKTYKNYMYLAGVKVPLIESNIGSRYASLSQLTINLPYSPYISHIHPFTKIEIYEQINDNGKLSRPTVEYDGVVIGITRSKNVLGEVSCQLTCLTDGVIWNRIRQYDFYLNQLLDVDTRGKAGANINIRADSVITNFYKELLSTNKYDIGCSVCSLLTSIFNCAKNKGSEGTTAYKFFYNGKQFNKLPTNSDTDYSEVFTSTYYLKFMDNQKGGGFHLANKVYGIATSPEVKNFFNADQFVNLLNGDMNDLYGENTYWTIAMKVMEYGFYNVYDIPNPCFIPKSKQITNTDLNIGKDLMSADNDATDSDSNLSIYQDKISVLGNRKYDGLGEYILKPISVLGIPFECNIIWPDQVISDSIFYDMINAPTRTLLKKHYLPEKQGKDGVITTAVYAGPSFNSNNGEYLTSFIPSELRFDPGQVRHENILSPFESQYGVNYAYLELSYAFDSVLLKDVADAAEAEQLEIDTNRINKVSNFLNYEFSQRYFGSRSYQIQVTPDVNIINGFPVVILQNTGEHIIAFCTGVTKGFNASGEGHKWINLSISYPRYYYENIGKLGNLIDPTSQNNTSLEELKLLIGSDSIIEPSENSQENLISAIENLYQEFLNDQSFGKENVKNKYYRATKENPYTNIDSYICDLDGYMKFIGLITNYVTDLPNEYPNLLFESSSEEDALSTNYFKVVENGQVVEYKGYSNRNIIKKHLEWISSAQKI